MEDLLAAKYSGMTAEDKEKLGRGSSKITKPGAHLVKIDSITNFGNQGITIIFTENGQTAELALSLENYETKEFDSSSAMNQLGFLEKAVGVAVGTTIKSGTPGSTAKYYGKEVETIEYPALNGKELYIFTSSVISGDKDDTSKAWVNQKVLWGKFFSKTKQDPIAISTGAEANLEIFEMADKEAKANATIQKKFANNKACKIKLAQENERNGFATVTQTSTPSGDVPDDADAI